MFLKFKKTCVFHGDRSAGEIVEFDVPPRDVSIVIGAGLAEYVDGPEDASTSESEAERTSQVQATPAASAEIEVEENPKKKNATRKTKKK